jgi:ferredoxin-NADP reductase
MSDSVWRGGDDPLRCVSVSVQAPGVKTFRLAPASGARVIFHAGQFVTVELPLAAGPTWRCFTIASSPLQEGAIDLTIKRQAEGSERRGTAWLHDSLQPGMTLRAKPPAGPFCLMAPPETPLLLVSAGSGATPMAAIARWLRDIDCKTPVHYVHLARQAEDWLFRDEIDGIAAALGTWKTDWLTTVAGSRPDAAAFAAMAPDLATREVFCCGPSGFMAAVEDAHAKAGGPAQAFRKEAFVAIPIPELVAEPKPVSASEEGFSVTFQPSGKTTAARPDETLLAVAGRLGIAISYACGEGICGTCRVRKLSGEIEMNHMGGIEDDEVEAGEILACCSYARSPLVLEMI